MRYKKNNETNEKTDTITKTHRVYKYESQYKHKSKYSVEDKENRYKADPLPKTRAYKAYSEHTTNTKHTRANARYLDKTPKETKFHNEKSDYSESNWKKENNTNTKFYSQDNKVESSPVMMCNASKPPKKMPSCKPYSKLSSPYKTKTVTNSPTHTRPYSTREASPAFSYKSKRPVETEEKKSNKIVISKNKIKYSRNKQSLDLKDAQNRAMNTYQPNNRNIETVSFNLNYMGI
jgi:hypothetical protein